MDRPAFTFTARVADVDDLVVLNASHNFICADALVLFVEVIL